MSFFLLRGSRLRAFREYVVDLSSRFFVMIRTRGHPLHRLRIQWNRAVCDTRLADRLVLGTFFAKGYADQVALATLSVTFQATAEAPPAQRTRQRSRLGWVNRVGAETMMGDF